MLADFWNNTSLVKRLYDRIMDPVAERFGMTRMELDVLLFLANNPQYDTATDIVERRQLTKSHISLSVRSLTERGWLKRCYEGKNRKTVHLKVQPAASQVIRAGRESQAVFFKELFAGFSEEERAVMGRLQKRMAENLYKAIKERG